MTDKHLINGYEIFVRPLRKGAGFHHYRIADTLKGRAVRTVYDITYLQPGTDYELLIYALAESGDVIGSSGYAGSDVIGASDRIVFRTLSSKYMGHGQIQKLLSLGSKNITGEWEMWG